METLENILSSLETENVSAPDLHAWQERMAAWSHDVEPQMSQVIHSLEAACHPAQTGIADLQDHQNHLQEGFEEGGARLSQLGDLLSEQSGAAILNLHELENLAHRLEGELQEEGGGLEYALEQVVGSLDLDGLTHDSQNATRILSEFGQQISGDTMLQAALGGMTEGIGGLAGLAGPGLEQFGAHAGQFFQHFDQVTLALAQQGAEQVGMLLENSAREVGENTLHQVQRSLLRMGTEGLEVVGMEIAEHLSLAAVGVQVTAALAPVLPELVAAKLLLTAINEVLEVAGVDDDGT